MWVRNARGNHLEFLMDPPAHRAHRESAVLYRVGPEPVELPDHAGRYAIRQYPDIVEVEQSETDLSEYTRDELMEMAKARELPVATRATKAKLIEALST